MSWIEDMSVERTILTVDEEDIRQAIEEYLYVKDYNLADNDEIGYPYGAYYPYYIQTDADLSGWEGELDDSTPVYVMLAKLAELGILPDDTTIYIWVEYQ